MAAPFTTYMSFLSRLSLALSFSFISDPARDVLQMRADQLANWVSWATALVGAGVAMEAVEPLHDFIAWIKFKKRDSAHAKEIVEFFPLSAQKLKYRGSHPSWLKWFSRIGLIAVVIGVVGEWRCGAKLEDSRNAIHEYDLGKLIAAEREAVQARAWVLHRRPRYTSFDAQKFAASLRSAPPQRVEILYKSGSEEGYTLGFAMAIALGPGKGSAGWKVVGPRPATERDAVLSSDFHSPLEDVPLIMRAGGSGGCGVISNPATDASAIREALANSGAFGQLSGSTSSSLPLGTVRIVIGEQFN